MPLVALLLLVAAALVHAAMHLAIKRSGSPFLVVWASFALLAATLAPVYAAYAWHAGGLGVPRSAWPWLAASVAFESVYVLALARAYEEGDLSQVYPLVRGTGILLVQPAAALVLGERVSALGAAGVCAVAAGVAIASWHGGAARLRLAAPLVAGVAMSGYSVADKGALATAPVAPYVYLDIALAALLLAPVAWRRRVSLRAAWRGEGLQRTAWLAAAATAVTVTLVFAALQTARVRYVAPAREVSVVVAVLLGRAHLGERGAHRLVGAGLIVVGVVLLTLG